MPQLVTNPPKILYKYRGDVDRDAKCLLVDRQLFLPPPHALNDPFDCYPSIEVPPTSDHPRIVKMMISLSPPEEREEIIKRCQLLFTSAPHRQRFLDEFYHKDLGTWGVASLSASRDHPLLWAHYAANFSGFAVGFRAVEKDGFEAIPAIPVVYVPDRPKLSPFLGKNWLEVLFTKSPHWSYEEEWRYVRRADDGGHGTMDVPIGCILEVCLGPRMTARNREIVLGAAEALTDRPRIYDVKLEPNKYDLIFELIN